MTKLRASDGKSLGTFAVGKQPYTIVFDGSSFWVTNSMGGSVSKLQVRDGKILGTFSVPGPTGAAFDGRYLWVASSGNGNSPGTSPHDGLGSIEG